MSAKKLNTFTLFVLFFAGAIISGCGSTDGEHQETTTTEEVSIQDLEGAAVSSRKETIKKIFYTIPAPMEMASLIQSSGADFDKDLLNDVENISSYMTQRQKAINLGVYGADLSYTTMFERNKESLFYFSAAKKLAEELGVANIIDDSLISRVEMNKDQKDSLLNIVSDTFWSLNAKFKEDGMEEVSAMVITGGWIEALHLAISHVEGNDALRQRIAEQKYSLDDLIKLLASYEQQDMLGELSADLEGLQTIFAEVEINKMKTETSKDENGTMVIGGTKTVTMSDETLSKVVESIAAIRSKYIQ
ncbi:MAG: hypothetical protein GC193_07410 [Cryomorphaceae bacterium]|nr:hypothetical protein [Cryomorphaceae bacterium]